MSEFSQKMFTTYISKMTKNKKLGFYFQLYLNDGSSYEVDGVQVYEDGLVWFDLKDGSGEIMLDSSAIHHVVTKFPKEQIGFAAKVKKDILKARE